MSPLDRFDEYLEKMHPTDIQALAKESVMNHHTKGVYYYCLKRTKKETVKLYHIPKVVNDHSGFLVHPHNHRYDFYSYVLKGKLNHYRFRDMLWNENFHNCVRHRYDYKTLKLSEGTKRNLEVTQVETCQAHTSYRVNSREIHTLEILEPDTIILIEQGESVDMAQHLYRPKETEYINNYETRKHMDIKEYLDGLELIKGLLS